MAKAKAELLTVEEVAERLKVHKRTVYRRIKEGSLKAVKLGRLWRVPEDALDRFISSHYLEDEAEKVPKQQQLKLF